MRTRASCIPLRNAAQLAFEEYNATNPTTKIEMVEYDSQGVPEQATALAQQAINTDKIVGLVGPAFSGESRQVGPILEEGKIPSVTASATNPDLAENGWKYWHRVVANDNIQGGGVADYITRALGAKKVFVIHDNQEYSKGVADVVAKTLTGAASRSRPTSSTPRARTTPPRSTRSRPQRRTRSSSAATTPRAAGCSSSCARAAWKRDLPVR